MTGERNTGKDLIEGLRQSFLRVRSLPGKARLNRTDPDRGDADEPAGSPRVGGGGTWLAPIRAANGSAPGHGAAQASAALDDGATSATHQAPAAATGSTAPTPASVEPSMRALGVHGQEETSTSASGAAGDGSRRPGGSGGGTQARAAASHRVKRFHRVLLEPVINLEALRELAWSGVPPELRPLCWRLLLGYLPPNRSRQAAALARKRREYQDMVPQLYDIPNSERSEYEVNALRQVAVDVPRTAPSVPFFQVPAMAQSLGRMLYIWGMRHTASGYVQGMNDLATPFYAVYLSEHLAGPIEGWTADMVDALPPDVLLDVEADCYWCLSRLLEGMHDHYTDAQPGIQITVHRTKEVARTYCDGAGSGVGAALVAHLDEQGVNFLQFAFRWVNCLLLREVPFALGPRLWDTYLAEGPHMGEFLTYVCASFLLQWERELGAMEFQDLLLFLQKLPTADWQEAQLELVLSRAFVLRSQHTSAATAGGMSR